MKRSHLPDMLFVGPCPESAHESPGKDAGPFAIVRHRKIEKPTRLEGTEEVLHDQGIAWDMLQHIDGVDDVELFRSVEPLEIANAEVHRRSSEVASSALGILGICGSQRGIDPHKPRFGHPPSQPGEVLPGTTTGVENRRMS
jgi:hypothetical protein